MKKLLIITSAFLLTCAAAAAHADSVTYAVSVDTSSQSSNSGYIDLELNPSTFGSADVTATISSFGGATLNPGDSNNYFLNETGTLDTSVILNNGLPNDYFESVNFGDTLSFTVTLSGAGVDPTGSLTGAGGSAFQLEFLDPTQLTFLFTADQTDPATVIAVGDDGSVSIDALDGTAVAPTPEPGSLALLALGGVAVGFARRWRPRAA